MYHKETKTFSIGEYRFSEAQLFDPKLHELAARLVEHRDIAPQLKGWAQAYLAARAIRQRGVFVPGVGFVEFTTVTFRRSGE